MLDILSNVGTDDSLQLESVPVVSDHVRGTGDVGHIRHQGCEFLVHGVVNKIHDGKSIVELIGEA